MEPGTVAEVRAFVREFRRMGDAANVAAGRVFFPPENVLRFVELVAVLVMPPRYRVTVNDCAGERGGKDAPDKASAKQCAAAARATFPGCVVVVYDQEDGRVVEEESEDWLSE